MLDFYEIKLLKEYNAPTFIENQLSIFGAILERIGNAEWYKNTESQNENVMNVLNMARLCRQFHLNSRIK